MHHDEANQAVKFGALLERGEYRYDARDHHGPTLYYLTLPSAWLRGQHTLASLDEVTLRGVPVVFGAATILLLPLLSAGIGRTAVVTAALLMALSPAMVFYSRMYIQEALFACFALAFVIGVGRVATGGGLRVGGDQRAWRPGWRWRRKRPRPSFCPPRSRPRAIAWWSLGAGRPPNALIGRHWRRRSCGPGRRRSVAALFYSSFFTAPQPCSNRSVRPAPISIAGSIHPATPALALLSATAHVLRVRRPPLERGTGPRARGCRHDRGLAAIGRLFSQLQFLAALPRRLRRHCRRYLFGDSLQDALEPAAVLCRRVRARRGRVRGACRRSRSRLVRVLLAAALAVGSIHLGWQAWRAAITYAADPRNPYVYAQTVPDAVRMAARIRHLSAIHPDGARMQVSVIAPPSEQWPLPWYLRAMPNVGYWTAPGDVLALQAPVIVSSLEHTPALEQALGDRYVSEYFGLRPELLLAVYIDRGLWHGMRFVWARRPRKTLSAVRAVFRPGDSAERVRDAGTGPVVPCYNEAARLDPEAFVPFPDDASRRADGAGGRRERRWNRGDPRLDPQRGAGGGDHRFGSRATVARARRCAPACSRRCRQVLGVIGFFDADLSTPLQAVDDFLAGSARARPSSSCSVRA